MGIRSDMEPNDYQRCEATRPMPKGDAGQWYHPNAVLLWVRSDDADFERYACPHCGLRFTVEIAQ